MKANELRVGNIIKYTNAIDLRSDLRRVTIRVDSSVIGFIESLDRPEFYKPIPLSPKVLEAAGFEFVPEGLLYADKHHCIYEGSETTGEPWKFQPFCTIDTDCTVNIQYLHQLQNLYFALTGTELEIDTTKL